MFGPIFDQSRLLTRMLATYVTLPNRANMNISGFSPCKFSLHTFKRICGRRPPM
nr:hypothetical protein Iba_chr10fCG2630 [Ipomoea batatas]